VGSNLDLARPQLDPVTGFGTRRDLLDALEQAVRPEAEPSILAIFSLDGAAEWRDDLGEEISNQVIAQLAQEFARFMQPGGTCYAPRRLEFAALFTLPFAKVQTMLAAAAIAVRREGAIYGISTTFGVAQLPGDADSAVGALMVADRRLVAARRRRSG
jgi:GGDEF domain-containing protein